MIARNHADSRRDSHGRFSKCIYETHVSFSMSDSIVRKYLR